MLSHQKTTHVYLIDPVNDAFSAQALFTFPRYPGMPAITVFHFEAEKMAVTLETEAWKPLQTSIRNAAVIVFQVSDLEAAHRFAMKYVIPSDKKYKFVFAVNNAELAAELKVHVPEVQHVFVNNMGQRYEQFTTVTSEVLAAVTSTCTGNITPDQRAIVQGYFGTAREFGEEQKAEHRDSLLRLCIQARAEKPSPNWFVQLRDELQKHPRAVVVSHSADAKTTPEEDALKVLISKVNEVGKYRANDFAYIDACESLLPVIKDAIDKKVFYSYASAAASFFGGRGNALHECLLKAYKALMEQGAVLAAKKKLVFGNGGGGGE